VVYAQRKEVGWDRDRDKQALASSSSRYLEVALSAVGITRGFEVPAFLSDEVVGIHKDT